MTPDEARIQAALQRAAEAFWSAFAAEFPEIKTGDLDPAMSVSFDDSVEHAARVWLRTNWPEHATV